MSKSLAHLREVAERATPGPWVVIGGVNVTDAADRYHAIANSLATRGDRAVADAEHIATFDPPTVLKLLVVVEAAQAWDEAAAHFDSIDEETNGGAGFEGAARLAMAAVGANATEERLRSALAALTEETP